jgi:hypothetical protein
MQFLENTDLLKIEDILPFFPDFVVIDDFKEEIAHALEEYSAHIDELKSEMDDATKTAESIKQDIVALKNRYITINSNALCSKCEKLLFTRQFYVFPCHHVFHADCLIEMVCPLFLDRAILTDIVLGSRSKKIYLPTHYERLLRCKQSSQKGPQARHPKLLPMVEQTDHYPEMFNLRDSLQRSARFYQPILATLLGWLWHR